MTTDLWMLVAAVGLTWAFIMAAATPTVLTNPLWAMGNREKPTEVPLDPVPPPDKLTASRFTAPSRAIRRPVDRLPRFCRPFPALATT